MVTHLMNWSFFLEGPRSRHYGRTAALRFIMQPCDIDDKKDDQFFLFFQVMEHRWNEIDRGKPKYSGKKPVPVPLCPPQIPDGLTRDRIRAGDYPPEPWHGHELVLLGADAFCGHGNCRQ
jgi:hypothetical protein